MLVSINTLLLGVLCAATVIPWLRLRHWSVRGFDFPRLQVLSALLILGVVAVLQSVFIASMPLAWWGLLAFMLIVQLKYIWPYNSLHPNEVPDASLLQVDANADDLPVISILSCNVLMTNRRSDLLLALINQHSPDILAILESDQWWQDQLDTLTQYPHRIAHPLDNKYGMHVYSQFPLFNEQVNYLVETEVPSMSATVQLSDAHSFHLHVIHPKPPAPGENEYSTARDVELLVLADALEGHDAPIVVTGDLNDVAWSRTTRLFTKLSQLRDPRIGRGFFNTFHADYWFARWPLDHVFVSQHFYINHIKRLGNMGSDHFPMLVSLVLLPDKTISAPEAPTEAELALIEDTLDTEIAAKAESPDVR